MRISYRAAVTAAAVAGLAVAVPGTAGATPGSGVTAVTLADHVIGGTDYVLKEITIVLKEITIAPGGSTGWHWHPGRLYGVVRQGTLTHNMSDCSIDGVYQAGQSVVEPSGSGHVHVGRNLGTTPVVLDVLYADPAGSPLAVDAPDPGCAFE